MAATERSIVVGLLALVLARTVRAMAQGPSTDTDAKLPPVDVPTDDSPELPVDETDPTAFTTEVRASDYGGEERSVAELIASSPGATIHRLGDQGQLATVELRGATADQVLVLLDGIPLTSAAGGSVDLSTIPPELIDHIEILRGDAGARYGAGALGGVVNIVTRRPQQALLEGSAGYGEWNTVDASAAGALAGGSRGGLLAASFSRSDGDFVYRFDPTPQLAGTPLQSATRSNDQSLSAGALGSGFFRFGSAELELVGQGSAGARGLAGAIYEPTPNDSESWQRGLVGALLRLPNLIGPASLELQAHGRADALDVDLEYVGALPQHDLDTGLTATTEVPLGRAQRLGVSVGVEREWLEASDYGNPARTDFSAATWDEVSLWTDRLLLEPAVRFDAQGPFTGFSPKLGLALRPWKPLEVRANVGGSFRAPTFAELYLQQGLVQPNPSLVPEYGQTADLGVALSGWRTLVSVDAFASSYQNLIVYEVDPPFRVKPFNVGGAWIEGLEASVSSRPIASLTLEASYTFLEDWNNDSTSVYYGDPLPYRPQNHGHGRIVWQQGGLRASLEADGATSQPLNNAGSLTLPGHFVVDAGAGVRLWRKPELWLGAEVKNLTNDQSIDVFGYPLPGTSFFVTLRCSSSKFPPPGVAP
jgi:iron complex outermembrane receptor protein